MVDLSAKAVDTAGVDFVGMLTVCAFGSGATMHGKEGSCSTEIGTFHSMRGVTEEGSDRDRRIRDKRNKTKNFHGRNSTTTYNTEKEIFVNPWIFV